MKRSILVRMVLPLSLEEAWECLTEINKFPSFVPFVKKTYLSEPLREGSLWYDMTTILGIPLKIKHINEKIDHHKEIIFRIDLPFGGTMRQRYSLEHKKEQPEITCEVTFDIRPRFIDPLVGPLLERQLLYMVTTALTNVVKK